MKSVYYLNTASPGTLVGSVIPRVPEVPAQQVHARHVLWRASNPFSTAFVRVCDSDADSQTDATRKYDIMVFTITRFVTRVTFWYPFASSPATKGWRQRTRRGRPNDRLGVRDVCWTPNENLVCGVFQTTFHASVSFWIFPRYSIAVLWHIIQMGRDSNFLGGCQIWPKKINWNFLDKVVSNRSRRQYW